MLETPHERTVRLPSVNIAQTYRVARDRESSKQAGIPVTWKTADKTMRHWASIDNWICTSTKCRWKSSVF